MDLNIYNKENEIRKNHETSKINDQTLIRWWNLELNLINVKLNQKKIQEAEITKIIGQPKYPENPFIERKDFNKKFFNITGGLLSYLDWNNIVVCGGCISNTLNPMTSEKRKTDVDLFIYNLDQEKALSKISEVIESIRQYCEENLKSTLNILKNDFVITLIPDKMEYRKHKIQIILRLYKCINEILIGFDIDSCAIAYDGKEILMTERSLNSFLTRLNVVDLSRRSPSYESRLYKYYKRGFGIYIPFEIKNNNKMYFMNRNSLGLDKLLYLLKNNRNEKINKFLNIVTQRINKRIKTFDESDYENQELTFEKNDIKNDIINYNKKVDEKFKYKLYNKYSNLASKIKFITQNAGQQLTGSFNPITKEDWVKIKYNEKGYDLIGRNQNFIFIKNNLDMHLLKNRGLEIYDSSCFNLFSYLLMYFNNEEVLIREWNMQNMYPKDKNLYNISYLELVVLTNRQTLLKYILEHNKKTPANINFTQLINLTIMMDNVEIIQLLTSYHDFKIQDFEDKLKKYNSWNIANHYCMKISQYQQLDLIERLKNMQTKERINYLHNVWYHWGYTYENTDLKNFFSINDYFSLTMDEIKMIIFLEKQNKNELLEKIKNDIIKNITCENHYSYNFRKQFSNENTTNNDQAKSPSFEEIWYDYKFKKEKLRESVKDKQRNNKALIIYTEIFSTDINEIINIKFVDPIKKINPFVLHIMKKIFNNELEDIKEFKSLYRKDNENYKPLDELIIFMDDASLLNKIIKEKDAEEFLERNNNELGKNILKYKKDLEKNKIKLDNQDIFNKYSGLFKNTTYHLDVFNEGILDKNYERKENIFGLTPCDYVINKLLYFYHTTISKNEKMNEILLKLLNNLRKSINNIDRNKKIESIKDDDLIDNQIDELLKILT